MRTPEQADRWTWLVVAGYTQLRLARSLVDDNRLPWERPAKPGRLTPARVRREFRRRAPTLGTPARPPNPEPLAQAGQPAPAGRPEPDTQRSRRAGSRFKRKLRWPDSGAPRQNQGGSVGNSSTGSGSSWLVYVCPVGVVQVVVCGPVRSV